MMSSIRENNVNVLDLWDATSNLAKSTTNSDALNIVDKLIRTNIENNMRQAQMAEQNLSHDSTQNSTGEENEKNQNKKLRKHKKN